MSRGFPSRSAEGPPQTSIGTSGEDPARANPQISEGEFSADTSGPDSSSTAQQNIQGDHQADTILATYFDDQCRPVLPERIHASLPAIPKPGGENRTDEREGTISLVTHPDYIPIPRNLFTGVTRTLINGIRVVAFLAAVSLPFLYLPILLYGGYDSTRFTAGLLLVGLHVISLAIGHEYEPRNSFGSD